MKKIIYIFLVFFTAISLPSMRKATTAMFAGYIDNINYGWEVKRNTSHEKPDIPEKAEEALQKYNGVYIGDPTNKIIYLTIDLGYESGNTAMILDVLKKQNVKATFFTVLSYLGAEPAIVDRIVKEGHSLQNHTANYLHLNSLSEYKIKKEIMDMHNLVQNRYGISMKYLRLPYEDWSERVLKIASSTGYKTVFWSVACVDWVDGRDASYIYNNVMKNYHNGAVILLHAVSKSSPKAVDMIISDLKDKGFEFRVLDI